MNLMEDICELAGLDESNSAMFSEDAKELKREISMLEAKKAEAKNKGDEKLVAKLDKEIKGVRAEYENVIKGK